VKPSPFCFPRSTLLQSLSSQTLSLLSLSLHISLSPHLPLSPRIQRRKTRRMPYRTSEVIYEYPEGGAPRSARSARSSRSSAFSTGPAPAAPPTRSSYYSTRRSSEGSRHPYRFDEDDYYYRQGEPSSRSSTMTIVKPHLERGGTALPRILLLLWAIFMTLAWVSEAGAQPTHADAATLCFCFCVCQ
jgi:hypothetical protein